MNAKHKGAHSELVASAWLLARGFEVYRNVSAAGLADFVIFDPRNGSKVLLDVKTGSPYYQDGVIATPEQLKHGVQFIIVDPDTGECRLVQGRQTTRATEHECGQCGMTFLRRKKTTLYCSAKCGDIAYRSGRTMKTPDTSGRYDQSLRKVLREAKLATQSTDWPN